MARADDVRARVAKELLYGLRQIANGRSICLLDEQVTGIGMLEGEFHEVNCFVKVHQEARHVRISNRDRITSVNLVDEQRNNTAAAAHDVAITRAADNRAATLGSDAGIGIDNMLHHGLGDAHGVNGISGLVGGKADYALNASFNRCVQHVVRALNVGFYRLHGEKLAARHLLEGSSVEDVVNARHSVADAAVVAHVAYIKFHLACCFRMCRLQVVAHVVLLLLIAGEDADFTNIGFQKMLQHCVAKGTSATSNHQSCSRKCGHLLYLLRLYHIYYSVVPLGISLSSAMFTLLLMLTLLPKRTRLPT